MKFTQNRSSLRLKCIPFQYHRDLLVGFCQVYPESGLQEFLEELDALCAPEVESVSPETDLENTKPRASEDSREPSVLKATEKKVRFSENSDTNGTETPSQVKNGPVGENRQTLAPDAAECTPEESEERENRVHRLSPLTEGSEASRPKPGDVRISAEPDEKQHTKSCSNRGNGT